MIYNHDHDGRILSSDNSVVYGEGGQHPNPSNAHLLGSYSNDAFNHESY